MFGETSRSTFTEIFELLKFDVAMIFDFRGLFVAEGFAAAFTFFAFALAPPFEFFVGTSALSFFPAAFTIFFILAF